MNKLRLHLFADRVFLMVAFALLPMFASAFDATNGVEETEIPKLAPACPELPPTFLEQNGTAMLSASVAAVLLLILIVWLKLRPRPFAAIPPEVQARRALEELRMRPEDGAVLSQVSQTLHRYFRAAFELAPGELTTTELCQVLTRDKKIGRELSTAAIDLLRCCDARKFSRDSTKPLCAAAQALELLARAETRRAQFRAITTTSSFRA